MSEIFREIDEELRRENLLRLWSRYWRHIIGVVVVALVIAGGIVAWRQHEVSTREAQSARFAGALTIAAQGKAADAAQAFATVAQQGGGYGILAAFEQADQLAKSGDRTGAVKLYDQLAERSDLDPELRDEARLFAVMNGFTDADPKTVIEQLAPLTAEGNPWRATALELSAVARLKSGDRKAARDLYKKLADDPATPRSARALAAEMVAALAS
ncbi:MAG TPA: tetratricopeptide repeat protein [Stellaceae bacterium]|nr:tetratricopeptide repeat protein [Stellaceae bacterium]